MRPQDRNFHCPDPLRRQSPLKFCVRGRFHEVVIRLKFDGNRLRGLGAVGDRISPSPIDLAHGLYNSLYYRTSRDVDSYLTLFMSPLYDCCIDTTCDERRVVR